ncbi:MULTISPECIES: ABC transporter permease [Pseudomonas]|jgi:ABC-2 type transport system permease protein|uniref:ABC transporter permease n=1 Tax=Pseudomonas TaxID=286 RepID=UPI001C7EE13F|nr:MULTISPECIES: ABC transporter permease [Pseudomonas]MDG9928629.1 ABC transporter permease [Pseudomonas sp. GD04042]MDH0484924.1 ABC transporter permease [Pseudomonas sp. GD04015]MDH0606915.1 ABC transporter permease [Pseudomonas sp. GD03869]MDH0893884.1 ABC transporter permease [Pseudomonas sp. GD03875]MDH1064403.1 ABC transporter permease [Pseudomonas sp. GD03985]
MNLRRMGAIVLKELRQLRRDKLTFVMIAGVPLLELVLFGYAINMDVRGIEAAVLDQANTARSREVVAEITSSQVIEVKYRLEQPQDIDRLLREGRISAALVVPADFEARLQRRDRPPLQLVVDGSDQSIQASARQLAAYPLPGWGAAQGVEVVNFYNPERLAPLNTVPGLLGVILTMTMVLFTAVALVREREHGNLELLIATPVSPWELTLGKVLPFVGIGLIQVTVILVVGHWLFEVPVRGSILELYGASLLFIVASLALGVWLSTLASTQFQAMQMAFFTFLPQILLSGFMFPFAGMPRVAQWFAELMPLTHYLRLSRGIMLRQAGLLELWLEVLILIVFCAALLGLAVSRIHKRLD